MGKSKKEVIEITEEGIILMNDFPADYEVLFNLIIKKSCILNFSSDIAFFCLTINMQNWMFENKSVEEYKEVTDFIINEYEKSVELINE